MRHPRHPMIEWVMQLFANSLAAKAQFVNPDARRSNGSKITSKCQHGPRGRAGDKIARMADERKIAVRYPR